MKNMSNLFKYLFLAFGGYTIFAFVMFIVYFTIDPYTSYLHSNTSQGNLYNYDYEYIQFERDLDGDGKNDIITYDGCAFLSATDSGNLPDSEKCTSSWSIGMISDQARGSFNEESIGQRYSKRKTADSNRSDLQIKHSYIEQVDNNWFVVINDRDGLRRYIIKSDGLLEETSVSFLYHLDELIYSIGLIALKSAVVPSTKYYNDVYYPFSYFVILLLITAILFTLWRRVYRVRRKK